MLFRLCEFETGGLKTPAEFPLGRESRERGRGERPPGFDVGLPMVAADPAVLPRAIGTIENLARLLGKGCGKCQTRRPDGRRMTRGIGRLFIEFVSDLTVAGEIVGMRDKGAFAAVKAAFRRTAREFGGFERSFDERMNGGRFRFAERHAENGRHHGFDPAAGDFLTVKGRFDAPLALAKPNSFASRQFVGPKRLRGDGRRRKKLRNGRPFRHGAARHGERHGESQQCRDGQSGKKTCSHDRENLWKTGLGTLDIPRKTLTRTRETGRREAILANLFDSLVKKATLFEDSDDIMSKKHHANNPWPVKAADNAKPATESLTEGSPEGKKDTMNFMTLAIECLAVFIIAQLLGLLVACVGYVAYVYSKKRWGLVKGIGYGLIGVIIAFLAQAFIWGRFLR